MNDSGKSLFARNNAVNQSLNVLMVTPRYFPDLGGVENHVNQVASRLSQTGVQVTVLTTDRTGTLAKEELDRGVRIRRMRAWPAKRDYYFAPEIYPFIQQGNWDVVHVQSYHTLVAPLAMLAALRAKIPYVLTFHGGGHSSRLRNAARGTQLRLLRPLLAKAERLVTLARFEQAYYIEKLKLPKKRFVLIPNGSDLPEASVINQHSQTSAGDGNLIASVGRLERYKGHQRIISAMPGILREKPEARLWVAGNGPYEPELRTLAKNLGVEDRVRFEAIPPDQREKMRQELAQASLVVLFSEYETHPIAILEALKLGRPVLVMNTAGLGELCEQGLARGVAPDSTAEQIAQAVLEQLRNPLIPGKVELPSWDDCARGLLDLYNEITTRRQ